MSETGEKIKSVDVYNENGLVIGKNYVFKEGFVKVKEETMFETGERIRCTSSGNHSQWLKKGKVYVVCGHNNSGNPLVLGEDGSRIDIAYGTFVKETTMSKYQELKERIENVKGWDKEADDILLILQKEYKLAYIIRITGHNISANGEIRIEEYFTTDGGWKKVYVLFNYSNQSQKLNAFKQALLWLLDHSDIKNDEKEEKIKELRKQMEEIQNQIIDIEKLRR